MSKIGATCFFDDLKSKVKVTSEVKVIQKNEKCGKLTETCGKLKISYLKFSYEFDIFDRLGHFVVAQQ